MMKYDVVVVGGGHAGVEAAHIAAKMKLRVLLISSHLDLIGQLSCNPAMGGIAKGTIVREIDALGGLMGEASDCCGIHFRMLNSSKGAAVWGNRAQQDKLKYRHFVRKRLEETSGVDLLQGFVVSLVVVGGVVNGVVLDSGETISAKALVLAMGTFLNGLCHVGLTSFPSGRLGEPPASFLTANLELYGIRSGRLKTGTSPRIDGRTINFSALTEQRGDPNPWPFSFVGSYVPKNHLSCWMTASNETTHTIIKDNLDQSPLYSGKIQSIGPRYCPSIEDKVVKFGERTGHTLFLEPEGVDTYEYYLNGLSSSLPFAVQQLMVNSVSGLENARIIRPGYGIEYDYFQPLQLFPTLESKMVKGLFFAGQINGTSGYEEAAGQGIVAGINAGECVRGGEPLVLGRETSYIGVLIDDLVTKGTEEPYRMFTSRAEHRLKLRQDNADERLMPIAYRRGLISDALWSIRNRVWEQKVVYVNRLSQASISPEQWNVLGHQPLQQSIKAIELLRRPDVSLTDIEAVLNDPHSDQFVKVSLEADVKYQGFVEKQQRHIDHQHELDKVLIPETVDYTHVNGLLVESRLKLGKHRPQNLAQASRIPGVTPADVTVLLAYIVSKKYLESSLI